jgi:hypothetical protein
MRTVLVVAAALFMVGCGSIPTAPDSPRVPPPVIPEPSVTLSIVIMSGRTNLPLRDVPVRLLRPGASEVNPHDERMTDNQGRASWTVHVPDVYTVTVREGSLLNPHGATLTNEVTGEAGWLVTLPE